MNEQLLKKEDIARKFKCGWRKARNILANMGVMPIDVGEGKSPRLRWLESSVDACIVAMHQKAQPKKRRKLTPSGLPGLKIPLADMKASDVYNFVAQKSAIQ